MNFIIALILPIGQLYWNETEKAWHARKEQATLYESDDIAREKKRAMRKDGRQLRVVEYAPDI